MANEDPKYLQWIREQPCVMCKRTPSAEVHHETGAGMGLRAHDHKAMPLCHRCHMAFHAVHGPFKGWDRKKLNEWQKEQYQRTRQRWNEERSAERRDRWIGDDDLF